MKTTKHKKAGAVEPIVKNSKLHCQKCGQPADDKSLRWVEPPEEMWCLDCIAAADPYRDY